MLHISAIINAPISRIWDLYTQPEHVKNWNTASPDWHTTTASADLVVGGKFSFRMEAKDGSFGFDFWGIYTEIVENQSIKYTLGDDRKVEIQFSETSDNTCEIKLAFEAEKVNPEELQQTGWQAILNNFKKYVEEQ